MEAGVQLIANAGVLAVMGNAKILIDALHTQKTGNFSAVPPADVEKIMAGVPPFDGVHALIVTHWHPDHADRALVSAYAQRYPGTRVIAPAGGLEEDNVTVLGKKFHSLCIAGVRAMFYSLLHEGADYRGVPLYGCALESETQRIAIPSDAEVSASPAAPLLRDCSLALLNFPWVALGKGRSALKKLSPPCVALYHLPFAEDDAWGYYDTVNRMIRRHTNSLPHIHILREAGQRVTL